MKIKLAYGREGLDMELPDDLNVRVVEPVYIEALADRGVVVICQWLLLFLSPIYSGMRILIALTMAS